MNQCIEYIQSTQRVNQIYQYIQRLNLSNVLIHSKHELQTKKKEKKNVF